MCFWLARGWEALLPRRQASPHPQMASATETHYRREVTGPYAEEAAEQQTAEAGATRLAQATAPEPKPLLRGVAHQHAIAAALAGGAMLVAAAHTLKAKLACLVFVASLVTLFSASATYHRFNWTADKLKWLRRLDHAAIFTLIAGTYTPMCVLGLDERTGRRLLSLVWVGAAAGFAQVLCWVSAPKWLTTGVYIALGWSVVPFRREVLAALGPLGAWLLVLGGLAYSVGGLVYAARWPGGKARVFGFHEIFHAFTVLAAGMHFTAVYLLVCRV